MAKKRTSRRRTHPAKSPSTASKRRRLWWLAGAHGAVALLVLSTPLVVLTEHLDAFALPKLMLAEVLGLLSILFVALGVLVGQWRLQRIPWRPLVWAILPLFLWVSVGVLLSEHPLHSRSAWVDWTIAVTCLVTWALTFSPRRLRALLHLIRWPALVLAAVALLQFSDLYQPFSFSAGGDTARLRVTSLAGAAGDLAAYLALACLMWQVRWIEATRQGKPWRDWIGSTGGALLCLAGLAVTQTITALLALIIGSAVLWGRGLPRRLRWRIGVGGLAVGVLTVLLVTPLRDRVWKKVERAERAGLNSVLSGRIDAWRVSSRMLVDHPMGIGHGAFRAEYVPTKIALADEGEKFYRGHLYPTFSQAHNEFLQAGAEWGWIGLMLLLSALYRLARRLVLRQLAAEDEGLVWSLLASLLVLSAAHFPWHLALTAYPGLLLLALAFASKSAIEVKP